MQLVICVERVYRYKKKYGFKKSIDLYYMYLLSLLYNLKTFNVHFEKELYTLSFECIRLLFAYSIISNIFIPLFFQLFVSALWSSIPLVKLHHNCDSKKYIFQMDWCKFYFWRVGFFLSYIFSSKNKLLFVVIGSLKKWYSSFMFYITISMLFTP